uniref:MTSS1-like protein n=1 Tax=Gouania willdenowi TaxID=441366 RepID=A0A8C5GYM8_GOUWI
MEAVEKECGALGGLFQAIVNDMKCSYPVWEDFSAKATKLHSQLRTTVLAAVAFLDAFQKVADMATNTRGATRDIGSALTRMCMRHRSIEAKLRQFTNALMESLIVPLQDKIEDWKKTANQLDKDHAKDYKRSRHEIKKKSSDTMKLQKKARKGRGDLQPQLDSAMQDVTDMCLLMEEMEKQAVRRVLVEERGRFCTFIGFLQPVVNGEIAMLGEITHLQAIIDDLTVLTTDPHKLPPASEQVIKDLKGSDYSWSYQTPPSSPSSSGSRKSSMCSSVNSAHSSASRSSGGGGSVGIGGGSQPHSPTSSSSSSYRYRSSLPPQQQQQPPPPGGLAAHRLSSVSSHDSGFVSQDANIYSKPPSPMPSDITSQKSSSSASSEASETCQSVSECSSPTTVSNLTFIYHKFTYQTQFIRMSKNISKHQASYKYVSVVMFPQHGDEVSPAASDLAMVLTRGLSMEQKSNRDSLQYSSGYSTETTTPSCSEDTIPSQGSDYDCYSVNGDAEGPDGQTDFDKSSTIPRHSNIAQNYRRMIQTKRPASTAGLPTGVLGPGFHGIPGQSGGSGTPGTATIRRTPSTKPGVRRTMSSAGPIPIRPPIVPVKTPTIPGDSHSPGTSAYTGGGHSGGVPRLSLPNTAWGSGSALEVYAHLVEKIGELVASAHALGEGQFPFPALPDEPDPPPTDPTDAQAGLEGGEGSGDMLTTIRRGVRLRKTVSNDRSAPRIL